MASINISKQDLIWSYIGNFLKLGINIILLPIILKYLTDDELGLWYVYASIGNLVILFDFGFASALSRNISYVWCGANSLNKENLNNEVGTETNFEYFKLVLTTCKYIYFVISLIALVVLLLPGSWYIYSLSDNFTVVLSWVIYSIGVSINLLYSYYTSFLRGVGAVAENNKANIVAKIVQIIITYLLLSIGLGLLGCCLSFLISGFAMRISSKIMFGRYDNINERIRNIRLVNKYERCLAIFKTIWHNASKDGLVTISHFLSTQANTIICSALVGLSATGIYGLSVQLGTTISTIAGVPFMTIHPYLQEAAIKGEKNRGLSVFSFSVIVYVGMFFVMTTALLLSKDLILYIKPSLQIDSLMLVLVLFTLFIDQLYRLFTSYISTFNIIPYNIAFIVSSLLSTILSYTIGLYTGLGIWALVICPITISLLYNFWYWPCYTFRMQKIRLCEFVILGINETKSRYKKIVNHL